jgi:hypothetical protein
MIALLDANIFQKLHIRQKKIQKKKKHPVKECFMVNFLFII